MKIKQVLSAAVAGCMLTAILSGCGTNEEKSITLKYVMPGPGIQENSKEVWSVFNDELHERLPGVSVDFEVIPLSEYKQKIMLMMAAREKIDIVNNYSLDFATEIANGSFAEMNDLLDKYGKELKEALPEWIWDYETVNGKIYGVPTYQMMGQTRCICFIKEYADQYLDTDALRAAIDSAPTFSQNVYDILGKYCEDLKANGIDFETTDTLNPKGYDTVTNQYSVVMGDDKCQVVNRYANDAAKIKYENAAQWYKKGYIRDDVLSAEDISSLKGKKDGFAFWDEIYSPYAEEELFKKYGNEITAVPYDLEPPIGGTALAGGTSIAASSKYPEQAMQIINLIQSDKELYNLLVYGREGIEYEKIGEDRIETKYDASQASENDSYGLYKWIVGNTERAYSNQSEPDTYKEWAFNEINASSNRSRIIGFLPDTSSFADRITQTDAIKTQYSNVLWNGVKGDDWEAYYNEFVEKLNIAGDDVIKSELQKQIDEFLKDK
ncbi:MAG: DUF3502 domain-containing protein [Clostridia bacterium]|nr:DUF3502 domain-containing protein [Clostridia bacterium]